MYSVRSVIIRRGVNDINLHDHKTPTMRIAEDMLTNDYVTCMDKIFDELDDELDDDFKSHLETTIA